MNKAEALRRYDQETQLVDMGFSSAQAEALRRISQTLSRWCEAECNGEIERSDSGRAERVYYTLTGERRAYTIPDRESGALRRLRVILTGTDLTYFYQTDPRGCALYLIPVTEMENIKSRYSSVGIAVY